MLKIRERERRQWSPPRGCGQVWTEWQIVDGRKVIARFDFKDQAEAEIERIKRERGEA